MRRPAQFDLRTLGLVLICFSVGLTFSSGSSYRHLTWVEFLEILPGILYDVLLITGAAAMVIGLLQQVLFLIRVELETNADRAARRFAVGWRVAVAVLLATSMVLKFGLDRQLFNLPENVDFSMYFMYFSDRVIPDYLLFGGMLVVLADSIGHCRRFEGHRRHVLSPIVWVVVGIAALFFLAQNNQVVYLVYKAFAGIEEAQATRFRRPGAYPNFQAEGYWLFWLASAATISSVLGSVALLSVFRCWRQSRGKRLLASGIGIGLLGLSAAFGYWYLLIGFPRISPDFAEANWASTWWEWLQAAAVLAIVIPAAAYRLTAEPSRSIAVNHQNMPHLGLHRSLLVTFALALAATFYGLSLLQYTVFDDPWAQNTTAWERFYSVLTYVGFYMPSAVSLLSVQLFWKQWRTPADYAIRITPIAPRRFLLACAALIVIIVLSIPTINAFCFAYWVSPWS